MKIVSHTGIKKIYCFIMLLSLLAVSCTKKNTEQPHQGETPANIEKLIAENKNCFCDPYIDLLLWKDKPTYLFSVRGAACDFKHLYYDQNGQQFELPAGYNHDNFMEDSKLIEHVWACK